MGRKITYHEESVNPFYFLAISIGKGRKNPTKRAVMLSEKIFYAGVSRHDTFSHRKSCSSARYSAVLCGGISGTFPLSARERAGDEGSGSQTNDGSVFSQ